MVSKRWLAVLSFSAAQLLAAATPQTAASLRPPDSSGVPGASTQSNPPVLVTPEVRGDIYMARKMFREAVQAYEEGPPGSAILLNKMGIAYHQMLDLETARKYYVRAIKTNPGYAEAINNLGTIYYARKSYRQAIKHYQQAIRLQPRSASMFSNLGTGYFARKDYQHAADAWQHALELDPDVFESHSSRGILLQERSVEDRAKFHYYMARTYAQAGAYDRALLYIRKALEEGFKERKRFEEEPEFAGLRENAEFKQLLAMEPRVL
jgi:tetratricopeptide (TPR) repeat protein